MTRFSIFLEAGAGENLLWACDLTFSELHEEQGNNGVLSLQTYNLSNKSEMLAAVRFPEGKEGSKVISLTTDLVRHLGESSLHPVTSYKLLHLRRVATPLASIGLLSVKPRAQCIADYYECLQMIVIVCSF